MYLSFFLLHETKERDQCTTRDMPPCCTEPDDDGDAVLRRGCVYQVITRPCSAGVVAGADQELACSACVQRRVLWTPVCNSVQLTAVYRVQSACILAVSSVIEVWRQRAATAFSLRNSWPSRGMATTQAQVGIHACTARMTPL